MFNKSKGFTLIELIVVIAIIAILAGLVIIRIGSSSADARNSRRSADMNQIRTAIEQYKAKGGGCNAATNVDITGKAAVEGAALAFKDSNPPSTYLSGSDYPKDPKGSTYYYRFTTVDTSCNYTISAPNAEGSGVPNVSN